MRIRSIATAIWALVMLVPYMWTPSDSITVPPLQLASLPLHIEAWTGDDSGFRPRQHAFLNTFQQPGYQALTRIYHHESGVSAEVQLFYVPRRDEKNLLGQFPLSCLHGGFFSQTVTTLPLRAQPPATAQQAKLQGKSGEGALMISWCQSADGTISPTPLEHLWWQYEADLLGRRTDCILVTISRAMPMQPGDEIKLATLARACEAEVARLFDGNQ